MQDEEIECWVEEAKNYLFSQYEHAQRTGQILRWEGGDNWTWTYPSGTTEPDFWITGWSA